jgi:hypothetical protein
MIANALLNFQAFVLVDKQNTSPLPVERSVMWLASSSR